MICKTGQKNTALNGGFISPITHKQRDEQKENIKRIEKENQEKLARIKREKFKNQLKEIIKNAI